MKVKMMINFVITGLLILMSAPAAAGRIPLAPNMPAEEIKSLQTFELKRKSIVLSENDSQAAGSENQPTNEIKEQAPSSKAADQEKSGKKSDDTATKPIKPFKPSEEIAAEQAVDFPVDI
jgi:hypothetical protein